MAQSVSPDRQKQQHVMSIRAAARAAEPGSEEQSNLMSQFEEAKEASAGAPTIINNAQSAIPQLQQRVQLNRLSSGIEGFIGIATGWPYLKHVAQVAQQIGLPGAEAMCGQGDTVTPELLTQSVSGNIALYYQFMRDHKVALVKALQGMGHVVMVVGVNPADPPALSAADVAVVLANAGHTAAKNEADVLLVNESLDGLVTLMQVAKNYTQDVDGA